MSSLASPEPEPTAQSTVSSADPTTSAPATLNPPQETISEPLISSAPAPLPPTATPPPAPHPQEIAAEEGGAGLIPAGDVTASAGVPQVGDEMTDASAAAAPPPPSDPTAPTPSSAALPAPPNTTASTPSTAQPNPPPFAAPPAPAAVRRPSNVPDPLIALQNYITQLLAYGEKGDITAMANTCEQSILYSVDQQNPQDIDVLYLAPLLLIRLIEDRIPAAINLLGSITNKSDLLISNLAVLVSAVSNYRYPEAWVALQNVYAVINSVLASKPHPTNFEAHRILHFLTGRLENTYRYRVVQTISSLYASIPLDELSSYIGIEKEGTLAYAKEQNWTFDEASSLVTPLKPVERKNSPTTIRQFDQLAKSISALERH